MKLSQAEIEARLAEVRRDYIVSLQAKRDLIAQHWSSLCKHWDTQKYELLYLTVHGLAGSAETFGLAEITQRARQVVNLFKQYEGQPTRLMQDAHTVTPKIEYLIQGLTEVLGKNHAL